MNRLAIDTSNEVLGVAIMHNNKIVAELTTNIKKDHSSRLMPAIVQLMNEVNISPDQLDKVIVANGPGSYTGTRIGVTTAKTLAWAMDIPIFAVSSLATLALNGKHFDAYICPFFDARRSTVFTGLYKWDNGQLKTVLEDKNILMKKWLTELLNYKDKILFLSPHLVSFEDTIFSKLGNQAVIAENMDHLSRPSNMFLLSEQSKSTSVHLVKPNYLRMTEAEANLLKRQKED